MCAESQGAFTGEVSAAMLRDVGCDYVLVGHSERRALYGEDDAMVARKFPAAQARGLTPVLCVGEQLAERDAGQTHAVRGAPAGCRAGGVRGGGTGRAVVAYEPVWAIGTGAPPARNRRRTSMPSSAGGWRRTMLVSPPACGSSTAAACKAGNAAELFGMPDVDGGLIGGASLKAEEFLAIWTAAARPEVLYGNA